MDNTILPSSLRATPLAAFDIVDGGRWQQLNFAGLLLYNLDTVASVLLPVFAEQYRITQFVNGDAQTRAFLKKVIQLYRKKGTPWAMREALAALGWPNAQIIEGVSGGHTVKYDAEIKYDGSAQYGGGDWALFRVVLPLTGRPQPNATVRATITAVINEFKPARCVLLNLTFQ